MALRLPNMLVALAAGSITLRPITVVACLRFAFILKACRNSNAILVKISRYSH